MLSQQQDFILSPYTALYDLVVSKDNLYGVLMIWWIFLLSTKSWLASIVVIMDVLQRVPIRMFKYLLLKTIYDISDVDVVERSQYDMSFKYFLGMAPEEGVINPSSLCKFRKMRLKDMDLLTLLIKKTVSLAVEKGVITSRTIIVDATHTASRSNPYSPIELLKLRSKQLRKALYEVDEAIKDSLPQKNEDDDLSRELDYTQRLLSTIEDNQSMSNIPAVKQRLNMLRETLDDIQDHYTTSIDEDARVGHKSEDSSFFGYKTHIAMSDERIITAAIVTPEIKETAPN